MEQEGGDFVISATFCKPQCFYYDVRGDECFSVSSDDILTEEEIRDNWAAVEAADAEEAQSFITHKVFELDLRSAADNIVDGVWVRRWKDRPRGILRSRCCDRGFLDKQKHDVDRHSSTASRLSHRLAVSLGVMRGLLPEAHRHFGDALPWGSSSRS